MTYGELSEAPLEHLSQVAQEVFLPVLANPSNQQGWPDVVAKEITDNLHKFIASGKDLGAMLSRAIRRVV